MEKVKNFIRAEKRLQEAVIQYNQMPENDVIRDGLIQRFEFTFELSLKGLKEYMIDMGIDKDGLVFPKQVLKVAYEKNIINNENAWLLMLKARNSTSHIYDDAIANTVGKSIINDYCVELNALAVYLQGAINTI